MALTRTRSARLLGVIVSLCIVGQPLLVAAASASGGEEVRVDIEDDGFDPTTITVEPGTTVIWRNKDDLPHSVISDPAGAFAAVTLQEDAEYGLTFNSPGDYPYHDGLSSFRGLIRVTGTPSPPNPAPPPPTAPAPAPGPATVTIGDDFFSPSSLTVLVGSTITWTNSGGSKHTTTGLSGLWDSGILDAGASYTSTFAQAGTYPYRCDLHPSMTGTIVATDGMNTPPPAPASQPAPAPDLTADPARELFSSPGGSLAVPPRRATVSVGDNFFSPAGVRLAVGGTVAWDNVGRAIHTVTSESTLFDSGFLESGAGFSRQFGAVGEYRYFCSIHPEMTGRIVVLAEADGSSGRETGAEEDSSRDSGAMLDDPGASEPATYLPRRGGPPLIPLAGGDASDVPPLGEDGPWPAAAIPLAMAGAVVAGFTWALIRERRFDSDL